MSAKFTLEGNSAGAVKAAQAFSKALDEVEQQAESTTKVTKKMTDQARRLEEAVNPAQKLDRQLKELAATAKATGLSTEAVTKEAARLYTQFERAGQAGEKAFNISHLMQYVGGVKIAEQSVAALRATFTAMEQERQKAADNAIRARTGIGQLSQLAASDKNPKAAYRALVAEADAALASGAAADRGEAATLIFDLAAAGIGKGDRDFAVKARAAGTLQNVGGMAAAFDAMRTAMGAKEVGSFSQFMGKALAAGAASPGTVEQLPVALARAGSGAKALGLTDEAVMAAGAILAKEAGSPAEGGTKLAALLGRMQKSGVDLKGMNFTQMIERLGKENTGFGGVFKDNDQSIAAFRTLSSSLSAVRELEANIVAAQTQGLAEQAIGLPDLDPQMRAANRRTEAAGRLSRTTDARFSRAENLRDALLDDIAERRRRENPGFLTEAIILGDRSMESLPFIGDPTRMLKASQNNADLKASDPKLAEDIRTYLREIAGNTGEQRRQTRARVTTRNE